jgi:hypothetical protein
MLDRMRGGSRKFRLYHRDANGMLVKEGDDPISASRYAMMMMRYGRTDAERARRRCLAAGARAA